MQSLILSFLLLLAAVPGTAQVKCQNLLQKFAEIEAHELPSPFNKLLFGIPNYASRMKRPLTLEDARLMSLSYSHLDHGQPREYGMVRLLNSEKMPVDQITDIPGVQGSIYMNSYINSLLARNSHRAEEIVAIEIVHTHPIGYQGADAVGINFHHFSESDFVQDRKLFDSLKASSNWNHLNVESYILFLSSSVSHVPSGTGAAEFIDYIKMRGYVIKRN